MIFLNILLFLIFILFWLKARNYKKELLENLDEKQYKLKPYFPLGLYLMDFVANVSILKIKKNPSSKLDDPLKALYVGEKTDTVKMYYNCNKAVIVILILFCANLLSLFSNLSGMSSKQLWNGKYINRPSYNQGSKEVSLNVHISSDGSTVLEDEIDVEVKEKEYSQEDLNKQFTYAKEYIDSIILNKNESSEKILSNLTFPTNIPDTGITVEWDTEKEGLVDNKGVVHNEDLVDGVLTSVTAIIGYKDKQEEYTRYIKILPKKYTENELAKKSLEEALNSLGEEALTEDKVALPKTLSLPKTLGDLKVAWAEKTDDMGLYILLFGIITAGVLWMLLDKELLDKVEKRNREMLLDYPEIVNKFTLLVGAGMSVPNAWGKICQDYKDKGGEKRYAYEEMIITYSELMLGSSEDVAYESFGRRVKLIPYLRFSSLIAQNVKKGSVGLFEQLELEVRSAFEERKELAKRMGEEAGTKLLGPMMLMLMIVLAIIMVPALLSFGL